MQSFPFRPPALRSGRVYPVEFAKRLFHGVNLPLSDFSERSEEPYGRLSIPPPIARNRFYLSGYESYFEFFHLLLSHFPP